jgi:hypothetical protein
MVKVRRKKVSFLAESLGKRRKRVTFYARPKKQKKKR